MAVIVGSFKQYRIGTGPAGVIVFCHGTIITQFAAATLIGDLVDNATRLINMKGGSRRRYPGGPTITYKAHTRTAVVGAPAKYQVLPGRPFKCERKLETTPETWDIHQMTYTGSFTKLYTAMQIGGIGQFILRSPWGKPHNIGSAGP